MTGRVRRQSRISANKEHNAATQLLVLSRLIPYHVTELELKGVSVSFQDTLLPPPRLSPTWLWATRCAKWRMATFAELAKIRGICKVPPAWRSCRIAEARQSNRLTTLLGGETR